MHPFMMKIMVISYQGMLALRRGSTELSHEDYMDGKREERETITPWFVCLGIMEVQAKKKNNLVYYA